MAENLARLRTGSPQARARAAERLGFLRAYAAEDALIEQLADGSVDVRRQAVMALAWCGGRKAVPALLAALGDDDWLTRQAAHVSLTNLTGMEFPFRATASAEQRGKESQMWRDWWAGVPSDRPPDDVLRLLDGAKHSVPRELDARPGEKPGIAAASAAGQVRASSVYKGPPAVLRDGRVGPAFWQTKQVAFPQWCVVDLGEPRQIARVAIHQYGPAFVMTDYELATSLDDKAFDVVERKKGPTPVKLEVRFPKRSARYVRIVSHASANPTYPTTFFEIEIEGDPPPATALPVQAAVSQAGRADRELAWRRERGLRALGALGGRGASEAVLEVLGPAPPTVPDARPMVRAGIRALGRLREEIGFCALVRLLDNPMWARNAADALGDFGDRRAVPALLASYGRYAKTLQGANPRDVPADDRMTFPSEDRMLETPYWIAYALSRLPLDAPADRAVLGDLAPRLMANLPGDFDTFFLYEPEAGHRLTRYLMEQSGRRQEACDHAFGLLEFSGQGDVRVRAPAKKGRAVQAESDHGRSGWSVFPPRRISSWLPCVCTDPKDVPRLLALLEHPEGWVRLNAAKTLAWLGDKRAAAPIAQRLAAAKAEGEFGYSGTFKNEEYDDPSPRWREGLIRALGLLDAQEHTDLIVGILEDERSVVEIRHAAAEALIDLGGENALAALRRAAADHPFYSVRHVARDGLRKHGQSPEIVAPAAAGPTRNSQHAPDPAASPTDHPAAGLRHAATGPAGPSLPDALVFIKGDNDIPNTKGTVEQADRWRTTYVVTDSGPEYRPGDNLYVLRPVRPDGRVAPLTRFAEGYVASPEVSWDAAHVIFTHRGKSDPWWHVWRVDVDGTDLKQLTFGPYHDVQPAYLPDGRIVFATSRGGIRDEYHGYPCTVLWVMNADGSLMHPIATNIGRDNEPAMLPDGRIVFSRLEVFYSRNKTELTLHAMHPDGTRDAVLYGPERRKFWRDLDHGPRTPADGQEAPLTHRVLRMTQPQPMPDGRHILVATQGGLTLVGPRRDAEEIITPDNMIRTYTTPFPLPDGRVLCASTLKTPNRKQVDLGLYLFDPAAKRVDLIYNDPATADYEPRPIVPRRPPPALPASVEPGAYSGRFLCSSVFATREEEVLTRGRFVRLVEGVPVVARHVTHRSPHGPVWQNHGGTLARVLGTIPLAPDGSFYVEAPADRLLHFQVLDSDRRVVGNQITWIYPRPGETKSCVGCHEELHTTTRANDPMASHFRPVSFLPDGDEFRYRAKAWFKGSLPPEIEERTRTVRAVNLLGR